MASPIFARQTHHKDADSAQDGRYVSFAEAAKVGCTGCGECCRAWGISIEEDRAERVEAYFKSRNMFPMEKEIFQKVTRGEGENTHEETHIILDPKTGVCPFLAEDKKCLIHQHLGFEAKGTTCQVFPRQPMYIPGIGGMDGLFFSSNYMLDLLFSDKPLDMVSLGEWVDEKALSGYFPGSKLTPADVIVLTRAYSHFFQHEKSHWKLAGLFVLYYQFAEREAREGRPPAQWNSARAEDHLKKLLYLLEEIPFQASMQLQMLRMLVDDALVEGGGANALILPTIVRLYTGPDGEVMERPNLIAYNRLLKKHLPALLPELDRVYRRFIAFKNYGLTLISMNGMANGPWLLLFHLALTRTVAVVLMDANPDMPPQKALRDSIFALERDFLHNGQRVKALCDGKFKDFLENQATVSVLARPQ